MANKELFNSGKYLVYASDDSQVLGVTSDSATLTSNYSQVVSTSTPLLFGGAQVPDVNSEQAWELIDKAGVTSVRKDFFLEYSLPNNITLADYISNKNDVSNPARWKTQFIDTTNASFKEAKKRGMKTIGIVSYAPYWLTHNGKQHGVPTNWDVYEDIVKKLYRIHRDDLDYIELWNEPSYRIFLQPEGSGLSREQAYLEIFKHASKAIREVDAEINDGKRIMIGGPVDHKSDNLVMLEELLKDTTSRSNLDFISFHHYDVNPPYVKPWRDLLAKYGSDNLPIFLTEWNFNSDVKVNHPELTANAAIPYTGKMLISFLKDGISAANYYSLFALDRQSKTSGHGYLAFYENANGKVKLLPQGKTWQLLSNTMGLGSGNATIVNTDTSYDVSSTGFINSKGEHGLVVSNTSKSAKQITVNLTDLPFTNYIRVDSYLAAGTNDAEALLSSTVLPINNGNVSYTLLVPEESVVGVIFEQSGQTVYRLDSALRWLYRL